MKKYTNIQLIALMVFIAFISKAGAQNMEAGVDPNIDFGQGLSFNFNNGDYQFKVGGMIQPYVGFRKDTTADANFFLNSKRTYFNLAGKAAKEKISFLFQTDFSLSNPLLDAWVSYKPSKYLSVTVGQQLAFSNNREMSMMEYQLQFIDRSLISDSFASTGREFGLFLESNFSIGKMVVSPKFSITSGDGRNSFGVNSTDYDLGGVKYGGRVDVFPFGNFSEGNGHFVADLKNEPKPKLVLGVAGSYNKGASSSVGEGHGDFMLYDALGNNQLPDYRKLYYDALLKFKGFSLLTEYVVATGKVNQGTFYDVSGLNAMKATEISQFLALGTGINTNIGYVFKKKYGIDFRYASINQEFGVNTPSRLKDQEAISCGITKYINENNLKISTSLTQYTVGSTTTLTGAFFVQMIF